MAAQLDILGFEADYTDDGVKALKRWGKGNYSLLLTDIFMPGMSGYELVREIRRRNDSNKRKELTIIVVTGSVLEADVKNVSRLVSMRLSRNLLNWKF
eukprot:UN02715